MFSFVFTRFYRATVQAFFRVVIREAADVSSFYDLHLGNELPAFKTTKALLMVVVTVVNFYELLILDNLPTVLADMSIYLEVAGGTEIAHSITTLSVLHFAFFHVLLDNFHSRQGLLLNTGNG